MQILVASTVATGILHANINNTSAKYLVFINIFMLTFSQFNEAFDNPAPFVMKTGTDGVESEFTIDSDLGPLKYVVNFEALDNPRGNGRLSNRFEMSFGVLNNDKIYASLAKKGFPDGYNKDLKFLFGITNTGGAQKVFATVIAIIQKFIAEKKPQSLYFSADEPSRQKLYQRLIKMTTAKNIMYKAIAHSSGDYEITKAGNWI